VNKVIKHNILIGLLAMVACVSGAVADRAEETNELTVTAMHPDQILGPVFSRHSHPPWEHSSPAYPHGEEAGDLELANLKPWMGYGACGIYGCPCRAFVESYGSSLCGNCGHRYTDHW
jgi:hypothetical protein